MQKHFLIGDHIRLRPITYQDSSLIVDWRNTPEIQKQFIYQQKFTLETHNNWMKNRVDTGEVVQFIIELTDGNHPIGSVYLRDIDKINSSAEYGIFIGDVNAIGFGYGTEAAKLILNYGFDSLKLHRIFLRVFSDNILAIKSYKKAGFLEEGVARDMICQKGNYRSMLFMAIINDINNGL